MKKIFSFFLTLFLLLTVSAPVFAQSPSQENEGLYSLEINLDLNARKDIRVTEDTPQEFGFIMQDSQSGRYLLAEYSETANGYEIIGSTENVEDASEMVFGLGAEPKLLRIIGLSEGEYSLTNTKKAKDFGGLREPIKLSILGETAVVDDITDNPLTAENSTFRFTCLFTTGFELPGPHPKTPAFVTALGVVFLVAALGVLIYLFLGGKKHEKY